MAGKGRAKGTIKGPDVVSSVIVDTSNAERQLNGFITKLNKSNKQLTIDVGVDALKNAKQIWDAMASEMKKVGKSDIFNGMAESFEKANNAFKNMKVTFNDKELNGLVEVVKSLTSSDFDKISKIDFGIAGIHNSVLEAKKLEEVTERIVKTEEKLAKTRKKSSKNSDVTEKLNKELASIKRRVNSVANLNLGFRVDTGSVDEISASLEKMQKWIAKLVSYREELENLKKTNSDVAEGMFSSIESTITSSLEDINRKIVDTTELLKSTKKNDADITKDIGANVKKLKEQINVNKELEDAQKKSSKTNLRAQEQINTELDKERQKLKEIEEQQKENDAARERFKRKQENYGQEVLGVGHAVYDIDLLKGASKDLKEFNELLETRNKYQEKYIKLCNIIEKYYLPRYGIDNGLYSDFDDFFNGMPDMKRLEKYFESGQKTTNKEINALFKNVARSLQSDLSEVQTLLGSGEVKSDYIGQALDKEETELNREMQSLLEAREAQLKKINALREEEISLIKQAGQAEAQVTASQNKQALNMESVIKRYNKLMMSISREHLTIGTEFSQRNWEINTDIWNLADMVNEVQYQLEAFYGDNNKPSGSYEIKDWRGEKSKLERFINTYAPFVEDLIAIEGHSNTKFFGKLPETDDEIKAVEEIRKLGEERIAIREKEAEAARRATIEAQNKRRAELVGELDDGYDDHAYYRLDELQAFLEKRKAIIKTLEEERLITDEIRNINSDVMLSIEHDIALYNRANKFIEQIGELYNAADMSDLNQVVDLLGQRESLTKQIPERARFLPDTSEKLNQIREENAILEQRIELLKEGNVVEQPKVLADSTPIDEDELEIIKKENGALEEKLELLQEIAEQYANTVTQKNREKYEELNQKDMDGGLTSRQEERFWELGEAIEEADRQIYEFGETYERVILKLANGKKIEILPDDAGLRKFDKIANEYYGGEYNGIEIEDVIFERVQAVTGAILEQKEATEKLAEARLKLSPKKDGNYTIPETYTALDGKYEVSKGKDGWDVYQRDSAGMYNLIGTYKTLQDVRNDASLLAREEIVVTSDVTKEVEILAAAYEELSTSAGYSAEFAEQYLKVFNEVRNGALSAADAIKQLNETIINSPSSKQTATVESKAEVDTSVDKAQLEKKIKDLKYLVSNHNAWIKYLDRALDTDNFKTSGKREATEQLKNLTYSLVRHRNEDYENYNGQYAEEMLAVSWMHGYQEAQRQNVAKSTLDRYHISEAEWNYDKHFATLKQERDEREVNLKEDAEELKLIEAQIAVLEKQKDVVGQVADAQKKLKFADGTFLDESQVAAVEKYCSVLKKQMGETYDEAMGLKGALDLVFDIKQGNVANLMDRFHNGNPASNAVLGLLTDMDVNNQKNRDAALRSINPDVYDNIIAEQKAAAEKAKAELAAQKSDFQTQWDEFVTAMLGGDAFEGESNLVKGKILKAFSQYGKTAAEAIHEINKAWLKGELEGKSGKTKYVQQYLDYLNNQKKYYDSIRDAKAGDIDIESFLGGSSDILTEEKAQALREEVAAWDGFIAKQKEYYGIATSTIDITPKIDEQVESNTKLTSSYQGLAAAVEQYVDSSKKLWDAYDKHEDFSKFAEDRNAAIKKIASFFPAGEYGISDYLEQSGYSMYLQGQEASRSYAQQGAEAMLADVEKHLDILEEERAEYKQRQLENEKLIAQKAEETTRVKKEQAKAAQEAADATQKQADAEKKIADTKNKSKKDKHNVSVEDIIKRDVEKAISQLRSAKNNETTLFTLKGVFEGEDLVNQAQTMVKNIAKQANLSLVSFNVKDDTIKVKLYNDELKVTVDQMYKLRKATEDMESAQLELVSQSFTQNVKALNENNFDVEGVQQRAFASIEKVRSSLHGLEYDLTALENAASNISSQDDFTKFNNQLKAAQDNIQAIKNSTISKNSMNPLANMQRDMQNANIEIETMRLKLEKFGDIQGVAEARQMLTEMTAAAEQYNEATSAQEQQSSYNEYSNLRSSFKAQTEYINAAKALNESQKSEEKKTDPIREQYQSLLETINEINSVNSRLVDLKKKDAGTGLLSTYIGPLEQERQELLSKLETIKQDVSNSLGDGFIQGGKEIKLPIANSIGVDLNVIENFLNSTKTQTSLTTDEINKFIAALQKAQDIDIDVVGDAFKKNQEKIKQAQKENQYFSDKTKFTDTLNIDDIQRLGTVGSTTKEILEGLAQTIAKNSDGAAALTKNFAQGADGIARLDFSVFDNSTNSLRDFRIELGTATGQIGVYETTISKSLANMQAANKQLQSTGSLIGKLNASGIIIDEGSASTQVSKLLNLYKQLSAEIAKGDGADQNTITKLTSDLKIASNETEKFYKKMIQMESAIASGQAIGLDKINPNGDIYGQLANKAQELASTHGDATLQLGAFDEKTNTLNASLVHANGTVEQFKVSMYGLGGECAAQQAGVTKLTSSWDQFKTSISKAGKQLMTAFVGYNVFYKAIAEVRKGIGYVKEIDLALTELKKVTDETEESYARFLDTASISAGKIGSTISNFTEATANFARLGYTMEESAQMAETAIVYKNVADGIDTVEEATDSIISTMKAFGIESDNTMQIIDIFNEVGKHIAQTA